MRFTLTAPEDAAARPKGVGLTALALGALILIYFAGWLFHLLGGTREVLQIVEQLLRCLGLCLVLLFIWLYWTGQNWCRIFVLLWSFVIAAREVSSFVDHDGDLASLMSQPVRFAHAILAVFLLYFLNTRQVRAWFKKTSASTANLIADHLVGRLCTEVERAGESDVWHVVFDHDVELTLNCPWRIVLDDNLAFASRPVPLVAPGVEMPWQLIQNLRVKAVQVVPRSSDLFITFEMGIELQSWSDDPRARQWSYSDPLLTVVADSRGLSAQAITAHARAEEPNSRD